MNTVVFYLIGNWMGPFRTESNVTTAEEFLAWAKKWEFTPDEEGIWRGKTEGRVVIEEIGPEAEKIIGKFKMGI